MLLKTLKAFSILILSVLLFLGLQEQVKLIIDNGLLPIFSIERHWALDTALIIVVFASVFLFYYHVKNNQNKKLISSIEIVVIYFFIICYAYYRWDESVYVFTCWCNSPIAYLDVLAFFGFLYPIYGIIQYLFQRKNNGTVSDSLPNTLAPNQDAPLEEIKEDKFGMQEQVNRVVNYLRIVDVSKKAFSIGVVGDWGYGKSSFFNFVKNEIKDTKDFIVMDFNPRSSKDIHCIQEDFLNGLREVLMDFHPNLTRLFEDYAQALNISTNSSPIISFILRLFKLHSKGWKESYDNINTIIKGVKRRIVVFVDDLDRLTAKELLEVLKVIDKNGAFNHVIFLSAYDKEYVNNALKAYLRHDMKCPYTDKYFDLEIKLPKHAFHLLMDYLLVLLNKACEAKQVTLSQEKVRESILEVEGCLRKRLHTIRDVKRFTNQFLYNYPTVQEEVDFRDYLLLELIKFSHKDEFDRLRDADYVDVYEKDDSNLKTFYLSPVLYREENKQVMYSLDILERLFPLNVHDKFDSGAGRICNANSFDLYFYNNEYSHLLQKDFNLLYTIPLKDACDKIDFWLTNKEANTPHAADVMNYMISRPLTGMGEKKRLKTYFQLLVYLNSRSEASAYWMRLKDFYQKEEAKKIITHYDFSEKKAFLNWMKDALVELFGVHNDFSVYVFPKIIDAMLKSKTFSESLIYECHELQLAAMQFFIEYLEKVNTTNWNAKTALALSAIRSEDGNHLYKPIMECLRMTIENKPDKFYPVFMPILMNDNSGNSNLKYLGYDSNFQFREVFPNPGDFHTLLENPKANSYENIEIIRKFYQMFKVNSFRRLAVETSSTNIEEIVGEAYQKLLKLEKLHSDIKSVKTKWTKNKKLKHIPDCIVNYDYLKQSINKVDLNIRYKEILLKKIQIYSSHLLEERNKLSGFSMKMVVGDFVRVKNEYLNDFQDQMTSERDCNIYKIKEILPDNQLKLDAYSGTIPTSAIEAIPIDGIADRKLYYDPVIAASTVRNRVAIPVYSIDRSYYIEHFKKCYNTEDKSFYDIVMDNEYEFVHEVQHWLRSEYQEDLKLDPLVVFKRRKALKK